jgi:hypothetical protein
LTIRASMNPPATTQPTRTCRFCAETISAAAKVCPRCRQWQTWRSLRNPVVSVFVMLAAFLIYFSVREAALVKSLTRLLDPPPYYTEFSNALQVLDSRMHWVRTKDGPSIYVTGILTNHSAVTWGGIEFECRFFNAAGKLVDAANAHGYVWVRPNDDAAFRAAVLPAVTTNEYRSFAISVSTARSARSRF